MQNAYEQGITGQINQTDLDAQQQTERVSRGIATEATRALKEGTQRSYDEGLNA